MNNVTVTIDATRFNKWLDSAPDKVVRAIGNVIQKTAYLIERGAKVNAPVDTGRLRSSISASIRPMTATIAANVNYAVFVHEGTRYMASRPFLFDATRDVEPQIDSLVLSELKVLE